MDSIEAVEKGASDVVVANEITRLRMNARENKAIFSLQIIELRTNPIA